MKGIALNVVLSLIIQSKITGRGLVSNGRIYVKMMKIAADREKNELTAEKNILSRFNNEVVEKEAYRKLDRFLSRFLKDGKGYPYELFPFAKLEKTTDYSHYLSKMSALLDEIVLPEKLGRLIFTLLEILRQDDSFEGMIYGGKYVEKAEFFGTSAHPKQICAEAFLLGLLLYTHKNPVESERFELLEMPENSHFYTVRYKNNESLTLDKPLNLIENIRRTAHCQRSAELEFPLEFECESQILRSLPSGDNLFIFGTGGVGKSTLLQNLISDKNSINLHFQLCQYQHEIHEKFSQKSIWILLHILLKYHYQYEYQTYDSCCACEGKNVILQQLSELESILKSPNIDNQPRYVLLLDGINELSAEAQENLICELEYICEEWRNVRIVITGRNALEAQPFNSFKMVKICGVPDEKIAALLDKNYRTANEKLLEILKIPMFLKMYLENCNNDNSLTTRGQLLDSYVTGTNFKNDGVMRFIVQFALPFAAKSMFKEVFFSQVISRSSLLEAIDRAIEFYVRNDTIYQNFTVLRGINKKSLLESRENDDFVDIVIKNCGFLTPLESKPQFLMFSHQYYRDYFAAKYIPDVIRAVDVSYLYKRKIKAEMLEKYGITDSWYGFFADASNDNVYTLIGEICGDYANIASEDFTYHRTILDRLLDLVRDFSPYMTAANLIRTMSLVRGNIICGVDFSKCHIFPWGDDNAKFSYNGKFPCSFDNCIIHCSKEKSGEIFKNCDLEKAYFTG